MEQGNEIQSQEILELLLVSLTIHTVSNCPINTVIISEIKFIETLTVGFDCVMLQVWWMSNRR